MQICAAILAHMAMNKGRGNAEQNRGKNDEGSRYGMAKVGRQTQPADDPTGTGLVVTAGR